MNKRNEPVKGAIEIIRKQFPDSEAIFSKAYEIMRQKANDRCFCDVPATYWHVRIPNEFKYRCLRCRRVISPLSITPLGRQHKDLTHTVELACRFYYRKGVLTPAEISKLYNCQYRTAVKQSKRVIEWMRMAEQQSELPVKMPEHIHSIRVCKSFSARHPTINAALDGLFNALPSLLKAMSNSNS
jgi:hypothetical protein